MRLGATSAPQTRYLDLGENACVITAQTHALVEPLVGMGTRVDKGQAVARLRDVHRLDAAPEELVATSGGVVSIRRTNPMVAPGDHLVVLCPELGKSELAARLDLEESKVSTP